MQLYKMIMKLANTIIQAFGSIRNYAVASLTAIILTSCAGERIEGPGATDPNAGYITLELTSSAIGTKATEEGYNSYHENDIDHALICLFPYDESGEAVYYQNNVPVNRQSNATVKLKINRDMVNTLFRDGATSKARVYVIANLPSTSELPEEMTIDNLKKINVTSPFASMEPQSSFVMDGMADVNLEYDSTNPTLSSVSGTVPLTRSAAKITLGVSMAGTVTDGNGEVWESKPDDMSVIISNGVRTSNVVPSTHVVIAEDYYSTSTGAEEETERAREFTDAPAGSSYPYLLNSPFYTYPNSWSSNVNNESKNMTYMTLMVPWKKETEDRFRTCYYTVPVLRKSNDSGVFELVRNVSYRVNINVNILGSFTPDEPLELTDCSYEAVDWGHENVNVQVGDYRYLVLDAESYVANNEALVNIPFYSSHETVITNTKVTYYLYNSTAAGLEEPVEITALQNSRSTTTLNDSTQHIYSTWIDNDINQTTSSRTLSLHHPLYQWNPQTSNGGSVTLGANTAGGTSYPNTTLQSRLDQIYRYVRTNNISYSRYEVEITFAHKDKVGQSAFTRTVKITQYPPMYIEAEANNYITSDNQPYGSAAYGNVYVNNTQSGDGDMNPTGLTGGNRNPNMYTVSLSQLGSDQSRYIIGDPRVTTIDNLDYNNWASAPPLAGGTNRRLLYYYPTDDTKKFIIAPKLRIASSYGVSGTMDIETARRRCASYQEREYPAGRWRLPTYGELEYIITLSNQGKIPVLFSGNSNYYCAQGSVSGTLKNGKLSEPTEDEGGFWGYDTHVRCVYDDWYWGDSKVSQEGTRTWTYNRRDYTYDYYPFRWGDIAR